MKTDNGISGIERVSGVSEGSRTERLREGEKAESDALQREAERRHEIELARLRVEDSALNQSGQAERNIEVTFFDEKIDDLDAYLYRFEGYATMQV